jgi:hypothetical protein
VYQAVRVFRGLYAPGMLTAAIWFLYSIGSGILLPGNVPRGVKEDGSLARYEEPGELIIKMPSVALGYANNAQAYVVILCVSGALFMNVRGNAGLKRHDLSTNNTSTLQEGCSLSLRFRLLRVGNFSGASYATGRCPSSKAKVML